MKILFLILVIFLSAPVVSAEELNSQPKNEVGDVIIDWQALTYSPWWYQGRNLPTIGSKVKVGLTFLKPTKDDFYYLWKVDNKSVNLAPDPLAKEVTFEVKSFSELIELKIFKKKKESFDLVGRHFINLAVSNLEAVIYLLKNDKLSYQEEISVKGGDRSSFLTVPYFFNIDQSKNLKFNWRFLGKNTSGTDFNPNLLDLNIEKVSRVLYAPLSVFVSNEDSSQIASGEVNLRIE